MDNAGRVEAIANLACVLAGADRDVLVVDWSAEITSVRDYLDLVEQSTYRGDRVRP